MGQGVLTRVDYGERISALRRRLGGTLGRLRAGALPILQTAVAASLAWFLASTVLGHERPFFAAIAAVISLGVVVGQEGRRVIELVFGVACGLAVADLLVILIGTGTVQIGVVVADRPRKDRRRPLHGPVPLPKGCPRAHPGGGAAGRRKNRWPHAVHARTALLLQRRVLDSQRGGERPLLPGAGAGRRPPRLLDGRGLPGGLQDVHRRHASGP